MICYDLFVEGHLLWMATSNGIYKIDVSGPPTKVTNYSTSDGLSSNIIKTIYVKDGIIYAGSDENVDVFEENALKQSSVCRLISDDIMVSGISKGADANNFSLKPKENNIEFRYSTISYKSGGEIVYHYRLLGLDTIWRSTKETLLSYPSLPAGNYQLELFSVNKYGVRSNTISRSFIVQETFFQQLWVQLLMFLAVAVLTGLLLSWRFRRIRKREEKQQALISSITDLEQMAFKSQMNPHFIFNCLNSIQQYVIDKDVAGANYFISAFSRLIRQTLDFSSRNEISLEEEIQFLTDYLKLEQSRLEHKFLFSITTDANLVKSDVVLPPLLLQPFVENAIRHGVRHLPDNSGLIQLNFVKTKTNLVCSIMDNGIGREASMALKTINSVQYQSRGLKITMKRIEALNQRSMQKIVSIVEDLYDAAGKASGTKITIHFPLSETAFNL